MCDWVWSWSGGDTSSIMPNVEGWWTVSPIDVPIEPQEPAAAPARRTLRELTERRRLARLRRQWQAREDRDR